MPQCEDQHRVGLTGRNWELASLNCRFPSHLNLFEISGMYRPLIYVDLKFN